MVGHGIASRNALRKTRARLVRKPSGAEERIVRRSRRAPRVGRLPRQPRTRKVASGRTLRLCRRGRDQRHRTRHHAWRKRAGAGQAAVPRKDNRSARHAEKPQRRHAERRRRLFRRAGRRTGGEPGHRTRKRGGGNGHLRSRRGELASERRVPADQGILRRLRGRRTTRSRAPAVVDKRATLRRHRDPPRSRRRGSHLEPFSQNPRRETRPRAFARAARPDQVDVKDQRTHSTRGGASRHACAEPHRRLDGDKRRAAASPRERSASGHAASRIRVERNRLKPRRAEELPLGPARRGAGPAGHGEGGRILH